MTIVVIIAIRNTKAPKAAKATTAPIFRRAPSVSLRSPSTGSGTFTLGVCSALILLPLPKI